MAYLYYAWENVLVRDAYPTFLDHSGSKGDAGFDNNAGHYKSDDFIGKTSHILFGKHLCITYVRLISDYAGIIVVCGTA